VNAGTVASAITLAEQRWAQLHAFDLEAHLWTKLFAEHDPGTILYAIAKTSKTRDTRPEIIYASLIHWIEILEKPPVVKNII
jgi:hypothetical protein